MLMKKFITLLLVLTGMVSTANATLYLIGIDNSWDPSSPITMTDKGAGVYEYTTSSLEGIRSFAFSETKGSNSSDWTGFNAKRYSPDSDTFIEVGKEINLTENFGEGGAGAYKFRTLGTYKVTVNLTTSKLKVTEESQTNMYMLGDFTGGSWNTNAGVAMTKKSNGVYSASITTTKANAYITFGSVITATHDWDEFNSHRYSANATFTVRVPQTLYDNSTESIKIEAQKTYTVVLDIYQMKAFIDDASKYYLMSYDGSSWTVDGEMTKDGFVYSSEITGANKKFVFVPDVAITGGTTFNNDWTKVIRPYTGNPYYVNFANYNDATITNTDAGDAPLWWINSTNPGTCALTFTPYKANFTINSTYQRAVTDASEGYATFSMPWKVAVEKPVGGAVKYPTAITSGVISWSAVDGDIPASTGVLLEGVGTYTFTPAETSPSFSSKLVAIPEKTELAQTADGKTNYILAKVGGSVGFYKVNENGSWVGANTAYLAVTAGEAGARDFIALDETTGIDAVKASTTVKGEYFNLAGQRVAQPTKGLYIVNGKKVIVK